MLPTPLETPRGLGSSPTPLTREAIQTILGQSLAPLVGATPVRPIPTDARLREDLGLDDVNLIDLACDVETLFEVQVRDADMDNWQRLGDVVDHIVARVGVPACSSAR